MSAFNTEEPLGKWEWSELLVSHVTLRTELLVTTGWQAPSFLCLWKGMSVNFLGIVCDPSSFPTLDSPAYDRWWWSGGILFPFVVPQRKETGSEENYGHTCSFLKNYIDVWLIFSVVLSSAALQCDTHKKCVIHIKILFLILFHVIYHWILNIVPYALQ